MNDETNVSVPINELCPDKYSRLEAHCSGLIALPTFYLLSTTYS